MKIFTATIALESLFSFSQCIKILNHMNLTINDLSNSEKIRTNFKETSNVFSYFVVTSYIMMNISEFIGFCSRKNYNILKTILYINGIILPQHFYIRFFVS